MRVHQFVDEGLGHLSYLIDLGDGHAAMVDPPRFPFDHETLLEHWGLQLSWTVDSHSHADYVTGSPGLAARTGAAFVAPAASRLATPHRRVVDHEHIELADSVDLVALATPGHTTDHHAYLVTHEDRPVALFSGGSLMVGTVGRTDLSGPDLAEPLARAMFGSMRLFDELPGDVAVYPTHGAGSFCSAPGSTQRTSTLGRERSSNPLFSIRDEDSFVETLLAGFGTFPSYFARLPEFNRRGPRRYDTVPEVTQLRPDQAERHQTTGGVIIDARSIGAFAHGHIPGSVSNVFRPVFGSWIGWLIEPDQPIVLVLDDLHDRADVVRQCLDVGIESIVGEVAGGMGGWAESGRPVATIGLVGPGDVSGRLIDVRQAGEYVDGHVRSAVNVELGSIARTQLPTGPLTMMCGHGERAATAASLLAASDRCDVFVFDGGPDTWSRATGQSLETGR